MNERMQRLAAESGGTAFLLMIIVGSGIMGQRLSGGNDALALLANSLATGAGLYALIAALQSSGAHFNPAVTLMTLLCRRMSPGFALACMVAQMAGAVAGVMMAHAMFGEAFLQAGATSRSGWPLMFSEVIATIGLLVVVLKAPERVVAAAVGAYIAAAYWFTSSTSFANPAVTLARGFTGSFAGIAWSAVPGFIAAQVTAAVAVGSIASGLTRRRGSLPEGQRPDTVRS